MVIAACPTCAHSTLAHRRGRCVVKGCGCRCLVPRHVVCGETQFDLPFAGTDAPSAERGRVTRLGSSTTREE